MIDKVIGLSFDVDAASVPTVVLKGSGEAAAAVVADALQAANIPVVKDPALLQALYRVPVDHPIGRELFPVMAALIAHVLSVAADRTTEMKA